MFWVFSESAGVTRLLISSVDRGNCKDTEPLWYWAPAAGCRRLSTTVSGCRRVRAKCLWITLEWCDLFRLNGLEIATTCFKKGQTNQPVQLVSLASLDSKSNHVAWNFGEAFRWLIIFDISSSWPLSFFVFFFVWLKMIKKNISIVYACFQI